MPKASFEEGTEVQLDSGAIAPAAGWTDNVGGGSDVWRHGDYVHLMLRVKNAAKAAALICTLDASFRPPVALTDSGNKVEVKANGEVVSLDGTVSLETSSLRIYGISYRAAGVSP